MVLDYLEKGTVLLLKLVLGQALRVQRKKKIAFDYVCMYSNPNSFPATSLAYFYSFLSGAGLILQADVNTSIV